MADVTPAVVCLGASGLGLAQRIGALLGAPVHGLAGRVAADVAFDDTLVHLRGLFAAGVPVVGVCAAGILIRAVAPLLGDKRAEPPVIAVAEDGSVVVPLLGGHRGANELARRIADGLGALAAITTAGDLVHGLALDAPPPGWSLENPKDSKAVMAGVLAGGAVVEGEAPWLNPVPRGGAVRLVASESSVAASGLPTLVYRPQRHVLGVGAARGCPADELADLAAQALAQAGIVPGALAGVATLDLKADEGAILALARSWGLPLRLFDAAALEAETPRLATPSQVVFAEVGCHGVAEAAALAAIGAEGQLVVPKQKSAHATVALARAPEPLAALAGRSRGRVALVGIGPGQADWRTPEASRMVAEADELVGYGLYIDLLGPLAHGKPRQEFPLGGEAARCRHALEQAGRGHRVALICSGDAGIYAMGALVYELLDRGELSDAARRVEVVSAPGVSALQAAAARAGAPLGHDFCAISLSDLLTPRADILGRIQAAAAGDFVIAFYNPVSQRRRELLSIARDLLLPARGADCPVLLGRSLGRPDESVQFRTLASLSVDEVDMMTVVLVGSSHSRLVETGDGTRMYTPRGYGSSAEKLNPIKGLAP